MALIKSSENASSLMSKTILSIGLIVLMLVVSACSTKPVPLQTVRRPTPPPQIMETPKQLPLIPTNSEGGQSGAECIASQRALIEYGGNLRLQVLNLQTYIRITEPSDED